jgi:hypothetical protein
VGSYLRSQLVDRQRALDAPRSKYIVVADVVPPTSPELNILPQLKAIAVAVLAGLLCGIGLAYVVFRLWERSRLPIDNDDAARPEGLTNGYGGQLPSVPTVAVNSSGLGSG